MNDHLPLGVEVGGDEAWGGMGFGFGASAEVMKKFNRAYKYTNYISDHQVT